MTLTWKQLERRTRISRDKLRKIALSANDEYRTRDVVLHGKARRLNVPKASLRGIQLQLRELVKTFFMPPASMHGGIKARSVLTAARPHREAHLLLGLDIRDCYPSITTDCVRSAFVSRLAFQRDVAQALATLFTKDNQLPQGAPSSPMVANIVLAAYCEEMASYCKERGLRFSMYADDVAISGDGRAVREAIPVAIGRLRRYGFTTKHRKLRLARVGDSQRMLGVNVDRRRLSVGGRVKRALGSAAMRAVKEPLLRPSDARSILGRYAWLKTVSPRQARSLGTLMLHLQRSLGRRPSKMGEAAGYPHPPSSATIGSNR